MVILIPMKELSISKFKATCLAVLERVRTTGEPVLITKRGEPVAEVIPVSRPRDGKRRLGSLAGRGTVVGDIVSPVVESQEWESISH
jgi:prevent-host-death family protein